MNELQEIELTVNKEFRQLIYKLTPEEYNQLEQNCLSEGIRDAICVWVPRYCKYCYATHSDWDNFEEHLYKCNKCDHNSHEKHIDHDFVIIDGHNRYEIAKKHGLDFNIEEIQFLDENDVKQWMIYNQFGRRNLIPYQRANLALKLKDVISEQARKNLVESGGDRKSVNKKSGCQISDKAIDTKKELAKIAGVSHDTINKVERINKNGSDELKEKLNTGEISVNAGFNEIKKEERKKDIEDQKEDIKAIGVIHGSYDILVVDPPWPYGRKYDPSGSRVANPYPEMPINEIKNIKLPKNDNCIIFLWTTHKFLPDSFDILKKWGFEYKATMVWNKENIGMGHWLRMQCEFCLLGISGSPIWDIKDWRDIITEPRREHSRKPDSFFDAIDSYFPHYSKLEYFSREQRKGWESYGNDISMFNERF